MERQEFLKQMVKFGQELLDQEQKIKINVKASKALRDLYTHLEAAVNAAYDLETSLGKDKRALKAQKAVNLIMKTQELMNPLAEDEDLDTNLHG